MRRRPPSSYIGQTWNRGVPTRHQRGSHQNEHAPISRISAHAKDPVLRMSKRLLSSGHFRETYPSSCFPPTLLDRVHVPPIQLSGACPPEPTGATARAWPVLPDSYYSGHSARTRPIRLICAPIARFAPLRRTRRAAHMNASTLPGSVMAVWRALRASV